jgi:hypothetical protein
VLLLTTATFSWQAALTDLLVVLQMTVGYMVTEKKRTE